MSLHPSPLFQPDQREIILASSSPRRRELLDRFGYTFRVLEPDPNAECGICSRETPPELVARLAYQKAANVIEKIDSGLVLSCDTVAECVAIILGKPENREHARQMLQRLRGRRHSVYSGVCLWDKVTSTRSIRVDVSHLWMEPITDEQLESYLDTELWVGKAGAFGFQDGPDWIRLDEGSPSNVVGLPMELLSTMLEELKT
ncbi:MAG: Maf family protein [Planctomycetota bacterium]|jgi:septum formation protein|nr:Maf family protein [Planctomycetota bacterium]